MGNQGHTAEVTVVLQPNQGQRKKSAVYLFFLEFSLFATSDYGCLSLFQDKESDTVKIIEWQIYKLSPAAVERYYRYTLTIPFYFYHSSLFFFACPKKNEKRTPEKDIQPVFGRALIQQWRYCDFSFWALMPIQSEWYFRYFFETFILLVLFGSVGNSCKLQAR